MNTNDKVESRILSAIDEAGLYHTSMLVALSGGADSVALLTALCRIKDERGLDISAAHFNHMIRGEMADADERFCERLCKKLNVRLFIGRGDVPAHAQKNRLSLETSARMLRYEFLNDILKENGISYLTTAHHAGDQAESVLLHLIRGSGLKGLCGMPLLFGNIFRPLLSLKKCELLAYLSRNSQDFCSDETNFSADGTRNKLRLELIPYVENNINPNFISGLVSTAKLLSDDEAYLDTLAKSALDDARRADGYSINSLLKLDTVILSRVLRLALCEHGVSFDIERRHIEALIELLKKGTGKSIDIPHISAYISYDTLRFRRYALTDDAFCIPLKPGEVAIFPGGRAEACFESDRSLLEFDPFVACMDISKCEKGFVLRTRKEGDRFFPLGSFGSKKLKDFFIDRKIPRPLRNMPLIAEVDSNTILYVYGQGIAQSVRVKENTERFLKVKFDMNRHM
ncbi:MAG: tRNA lysidine(34) synthetase TilS [Clostridia bacterium]|nr:tRNA lysidine(34) synthetase TilS [Clostridia bacterium]